MSILILNQLIELFPNVSEEFLSGIYDAYKEDEVTCDELVDVILSYEFLPPRENVNEYSPDMSNVGANGPIDVKSEGLEPEVPSLTIDSNVDQPVEDEVLQKSAPLVNGNLHSKGKETLLKKFSDIKQSDGSENLGFNENLNQLKRENNETNDTFAVSSVKVKVELNYDAELEVSANSVTKNQCDEINRHANDLNNSTYSTNHELSNGDEDDSPEYSIKYLMEEESVYDAELEVSANSVMKKQCDEINRHANDLNNSTYSTNHELSNGDEDDSPEYSIKYLIEEESVMEKYNITTHLKELEEAPEESKESAAGDSELTEDSCRLATNTASNLVLPKGKTLGTKPKKSRQPQKKSTCSNMTQNGCFQASPQTSFTSNKRVALRSCKVKNEEERLRRRLISQSRLFHERQEKNASSSLCASQFLDIDTKYALLCNIFTDANPAYLLDHCELLTDQEKILAFISQNLELRDYPKIELLKEEPKLMEEFHCTVADFVEVIPDPVEEFSSARYIRAGYEENAEIYLNARYNGLCDQDMEYRLRACRYNLSAVCTQLEDEGRIPTPGVLDYTPLHHPANVFFHQEVWYIEHRREVHEYLDSAVEAIRMQEELNRPPPPPDEVFECEICREEIVEYINLGTCDAPTGHLFCVDCIKRSAEVRIGDGETTFPCLVNCGYLIPLRTIEELLPPPVFDKLMGRIQEDEIRRANIAGVETCPFCPFAYGPGLERLFTCLNPDCRKLSCRVCRKEDHSPEICEMFKNEDEETARLIIENRMAEALMRTCNSCGKNFVKSDGCNKMACTCGAKMCYVCRQPVVDYSHFNGPGGDNTDRCPLFSNDDELHARPVEATAQQVFNELAANNPQLHLDPTKLIPK